VRLVLLPSPLVSALSWRACADQLRAEGYQPVIPAVTVLYAPYHDSIAQAVARELADPEPVVLVAHSGAGALLPAIAAHLPGPVRAAVYVDALLPTPGESWFDGAPAALAERLRELATDGVLPPWHEWFPQEAIVGLLPDPELRAEFTGSLPRLPLAYFAEAAPALPAYWPPPSGYLQLSTAYDAQAAQARALGWPVRTLHLDHLALLTRPALVAAPLADLVTELTR